MAISSKISDLTYKVVAFSEVPNFNTDECVDWAVEMLCLDYEIISTLILSSLTKPTNYFETIPYLVSAIKELRLVTKTGEEGILSYSSYFINKIAQHKDIKENLVALYRYCSAKNYEKVIYDFYLLFWAWDDLDYGNEYQSYWPTATKQNIESITKTIAIQWLKEHKQRYVQPNISADLS